MQQQPPTLQPEEPPLPPPQLNLIPPPSSSAQQPPPLITQPFPQQQPSNVPPPPSGPIYPVPSFPTQGFTYQSPTLVSQSSFYDSIGTMHIVGEVINQSPVTARFVKIIVTFYNANNQVIGTDFAYTDPTDLVPGQRAPFDVLAISGSVPLHQMSYYGLSIDSEQP